MEFDLIYNISLNQNILPKLRHALFNQYNALIGFTEVLSEEENSDETSKFLLDRVTYNARRLYQNTQLIIEFEQLISWDFQLKSEWVEPVDFVISLLEHRKNKKAALEIDLQYEESMTYEINIENKPFRTALNWFLDTLSEEDELSSITGKINVGDFCVIEFECVHDKPVMGDFVGEINQFNRFINSGEMASQINHRIFMLLYLHLVAEKLGGEFEIETGASASFYLLAKWRFPVRNLASTRLISREENKTEKEIAATEKQAEKNFEWPSAIREELDALYLQVKDTFILDEWASFADKLNQLCIKHQKYDMQFVNQIVQDIRMAIVGFDIISLQKISRKIEQISKSK